MKYSVAAVLVAAAGASAHYGGNVTYTTITTDKIVTYCPGPTEIVHGDKTYTVTEEGTITITDCPCTVTKPVTTSTEVVCHTCEHPEKPTAPVEAPPAASTPEVEVPPPTGGVNPPPPASETPEVPTAGAATLSGAGLAGLLGLAAFVL